MFEVPPHNCGSKVKCHNKLKSPIEDHPLQKGFISENGDPNKLLNVIRLFSVISKNSKCLNNC